MQADVVIAFTLPVDLMSLDEREGTARGRKRFRVEDRLGKNSSKAKGPRRTKRKEAKNTAFVFTYTCTIGFECNTSRRLEATTTTVAKDVESLAESLEVESARVRIVYIGTSRSRGVNRKSVEKQVGGGGAKG